MDRYIDRDKYKTWEARHQQQLEIKKQFNKEKCVVNKKGYNKYFVINGKTMKVENGDLSAVNDNMKTGKIKSIFSKSMKGRIISRTLLNKFIEEVCLDDSKHNVFLWLTSMPNYDRIISYLI